MISTQIHALIPRIWQVLVRREPRMKYFTTANGLIAGFPERSRQGSPVGPYFSEVVDELPALRVRGSAARQERIAAGRAECLLGVRPRECDRLFRERRRPRRHHVITAVTWQLWSQVVRDHHEHILSARRRGGSSCKSQQYSQRHAAKALHHSALSGVIRWPNARGRIIYAQLKLELQPICNPKQRRTAHLRAAAQLRMAGATLHKSASHQTKRNNRSRIKPKT